MRLYGARLIALGLLFAQGRLLFPHRWNKVVSWHYPVVMGIINFRPSMTLQTRLPVVNNIPAIIKSAAGPMLLVLTGLGMACMSWQKWADLVVDFGLKPYIAWRVSEGDVLYRDIFYLHGPLSTYLHAILFRLFGPGIMVLAVFNLFLAAWLTGLIYSMFLKFSDKLTATVAGMAFLTVFAFAHYGWSGNFNFICPYTYELTQGVFLSFLALHQLGGYLRDGRDAKLNISGVLTGLVVLTKIEVFLALAVAQCAGWIGIYATGRLPFPAFLKKLGWFAAFFCLPSVLFMFYFFQHMPPGKAVMAVFQPWFYMSNPAVRSLPFYKNLMGTDAVFANFAKMSLYALSYGFLFLLVFALNHWLKKLSSMYSAIPIALSALTFEVCTSLFPEIPWVDLERPLPLLLLGYGVCLLVVLMRQINDPETFSNGLPLVVFTVFSFVLLFKMILNTHVFHYGFALALPGTLLAVKIALYDLSGKARRISGGDVIYKAVALTMICFVFGAHVWLSHRNYRQKTYPVGVGLDMVMDHSPPFGRGLIVQTALEFINHEMSASDTFVTLPTAPMLNYLARHKIPLEHLEFNPVIWKMFGETAYLQALEKAAPSYVILIEDNSTALGYRYFGQDYGLSILSWIMANYKPVKQIGAPPFTGQGFGIQVLKRSDQ
jgi:hypothetical protein